MPPALSCTSAYRDRTPHIGSLSFTIGRPTRGELRKQGPGIQLDPKLCYVELAKEIFNKREYYAMLKYDSEKFDM